ncbi:MAG: helix-turn-helix domain-containing protein [Ignavibacteriae bacterium]|nr:MAG: helix-turn-helix domain-containing protein [Ignavibacteriota bacterium]
MATHYLSVKEVAALLGVSPKTVYKMIYQGVLPGHFMLGTMHFVDEDIFRSSLKIKATEIKKTALKSQSRPEDRHGLMK